MDGILNINKPQEWTSHDVIGKLRRLTGEKRCGHTGTLDPMAEGVLVVGVGKGTRLIEYMEQERPDAKEYRCRMKLGLITDTLDIWGKALEERPLPADLTAARIEEALTSFIGVIKQVAPLYSAVKYKGKKLYEYAREGKAPPPEARKEREVTIARLTVEDVDLAAGTADFTVACSSGTYIRTLCADAGEALGCGAVMAALTRTRSMDFKIEDTCTLEDIKLLPLDAGLGHLGKVALSEADARRFTAGLAADVKDIPAAPVRVYAAGQLIGIGKEKGGRLAPIKVLQT
ncbi:MAG: tRNA pseudouridine(55) synthase TruB [Clostridiales Family XIII bacterium]|jgi:tRNA pseudouridine55 synthase|nr:tRNA pseudouridine(55) synthase TruB [Clostridiales Family XIII bacterium]